MGVNENEEDKITYVVVSSQSLYKGRRSLSRDRLSEPISVPESFVTYGIT